MPRAILAFALLGSLFFAGPTPDPAPPPPPSVCESFITITQYPADPYYQATTTIRVEYGYIETGQCAPPFDGMDPWTNFHFYLNGVDRRDDFSIGANEAVATNFQLVDEALNTMVAENLGNTTEGHPRTDTDTKTSNVDTTPAPAVSTAPYNYSSSSPSRCEATCFEAAYEQGTVPYVTLDAPRNVTVRYDGDRAHPRPFIHVDVTHPAGTLNVPQQFWLEVKVNGSYVTFLNGETKLRFAGSSQTVRLGGQFDASSYATGMDSLTLIVTSQYASKNEVTTVTSRLMTVNTRTSPIGRGWAIAGLQRLYFEPDGSILVADGDGTGVYFNKACGGCSFTTPLGEFSQLVAGVAQTDSAWVRRYPDSTKAMFDGTGLLKRVVDRFGNATRFVYDGSNRLWKIQDPTHGGSITREIVLGYGSAHGLDSILDPMGRLTRVTVGSDSLLKAIRDPDNDSTRFTYDGSKRLSTIVNRAGATTQFLYRSPSWKLDTLVLPAVSINGGATQSPKIRYSPWQIVGVPTGSTSGTPFTPVVPSSVQGSVTDAEGHATTFKVDVWGQSLVVTDPLSRTSTITRDANGLPLSVAYPAGGTDSLRWDGWGRLTYERPHGKSATNIRYGAYSQVDSVWGTDQAPRRLFVGAAGRIDSVRLGGASGPMMRLTYDSRGRVLTVTDQQSHQTAYHYDAVFGNADSLRVPGSRWSRTRFDRFGRDSATHAQYEPWRRVIYDALNRPTEVYDGVNATPTRYAYDKMFLVRVQDAKNQVYKFGYNALGWLERRYDAADTTKYDAYRYNRDGLLTEWRNRRASTDSLRYAYDVLHRLVAKTGRNTMADSFAFSTNGRQLLAWNGVARDSTFLSVGLEVDSVVTWLGGKRFRLRPHVNQAGALDSLLIASSNTSIVFPKRRFYRRTATTQWLDSLGLDNTRIRFTLSSEGQPTNTQLPTAPAVNWGRAFTSLHGRATDSLSTTTLNTALGHGFGYDSLGRLAREVNAARNFARYFAYDSLGRLRQAMMGPTSGCALTTDYGWSCAGPYDDTTRTYQYDAVGNRTDHSGSYGAGNRIQSFDGRTFGHDNAGNVVWQCCSGGDTTKYFWSAEGRLDSVKVGASLRLHFAYDAGGRLVRRSTNGAVDRYFLWSGDLLLAELNSTATGRVAEYAYYPGIDRPLAMITGSTTPTLTRYFIQDPLGNVLAVVKDTFIHQKILYDEWGKQTVTGSVADTNRLRWKGLLWEGAAGLYYMRARWYEPGIGRFISEDPTSLNGGMNLYVFGNDDPVNAGDPSGLDVEECDIWSDDWMNGSGSCVDEEDFDYEAYAQCVGNAECDLNSISGGLNYLDQQYRPIQAQHVAQQPVSGTYMLRFGRNPSYSHLDPRYTTYMYGFRFNGSVNGVPVTWEGEATVALVAIGDPWGGGLLASRQRMYRVGIEVRFPNGYTFLGSGDVTIFGSDGHGFGAVWGVVLPPGFGSSGPRPLP